MPTENEQTAQKCEAQITRYPDDFLGKNGIATKTVCQRCEVLVIHRTANNNPRDIASADNSLNVVLQNCPKLIDDGHIAGQIPEDLLPDL